MRTPAIVTILCTYVVVTYQTPLPHCPAALPENFLLDSSKYESHCGLPSARSYILSKFNAALYVEPHKKAIAARKHFSLRVLACHVTKSMRKANPFEDKISVNHPEPWDDVEACMATEITIWARLRNKMGYHAPTQITRLEDVCGWELTFKIDNPGTYRADVMSTWLRGSIDSASETCEAERHTQWEGGIPLRVPAIIKRGSPFMSCCDLCSMYERCAYWTMVGESKQNCYMFTNETAPWKVSNKTIAFKAKNGHVSHYPLSGVRKQEPQAMYLGGIINGVQGWTSASSECREQANVLNSPLKISVLGHEVSDRKFSKDLCTKGDHPGSWVRFDTEKCPTAQGELQQLTIGAVQLGTKVIAGEPWVEWYNDEYEALFYESRYNKAMLRFHWNPPKGWPGAMASSEAIIPPPWQKMPMCTMGHEMYPDSNLRKYQMSPVSYQPGVDWQSGFKWQPDSCDYEHFTRAQIRRGLTDRGFGRILIGGDSVMGGFGQVIKWMTGLSKMSVTNRWYSDTVHHQIRSVTENSRSVNLEIAGMECNLDKPDRCITAVLHNQTKSIVVVNFGIQHVMWNEKLSTVESWLRDFETAFELARDLFKKGSRFIFVNSIAIHGFREPYCTTERAQRFSALIANTVERMGWDVVDAFNMTYSRPDLSVDGMHFGDNMNYMMAQVLFNTVLNKNED